MDESCISNPKSEISDWTGPVQSDISDFGFEMQDSSNFKIPLLCYCASEITPAIHEFIGATDSPMLNEG